MKAYKLPLLRHKLVYLSMAGIATLTLLPGCSNDDFSDLNQYIAEVKLRPKGTIKPLPINEPVEPFIFKPENSPRDPFKAIKPRGECEDSNDCPEEKESLPGTGPDTKRRKEELEAFPIESLKMIGTVNMKSNLWGLIKSSDRTVYRVQVGNHMGQNYGRIIRINPDKIELMEWIKDQQGVWSEQQMSIKLTDELGG